MRVIATAGHVDHGKSALVEALTGTHPDRLKEEQQREMTIDLGFAYFSLPDGELVGVVDVPGHRDFIENMLAGVGGIDAALLVIAADEGVMPQTREHLAILDLLHVRAAVVALNKADLVDDPEWMALVRQDIQRALRPTALADSEILPVSARTRAGLPALAAALTRCLAAQPRRPDLGRPRLGIDRAFTLAGFGTVVTGTLLDGVLTLGEEVEILPGVARARVRGLQSHHTKIERALPGSRVAVNLSGVNVEDLERGMTLAHPDTYRVTRLVDVQLDPLPDAGRALEHNQHLKLFLGTQEVLARLRVLGAEAITPGQPGWAQLELKGAVVAARDDRFILRRPSPGTTVGGGRVVEPHPPRRHRRFEAQVIARFEALAAGQPAEVLLQAASALGLAAWREVAERARLAPEHVAPALEALRAQGALVILSGDPPRDAEALLVTQPGLAALISSLTRALADYHAANPLRRAMPKEEVRSRLALAPRALAALLGAAAAHGEVVDEGPGVRLPAHAPRFSPDEERAVAALVAQCARDPYNTPSVKMCLQAVGEPVYAALLDQGRLRQVSSEVVLLAETYQAMVARVREVLQQKGTLTVAEARDLFGSSRKYVLALLEHLDEKGLTQRIGDERRLRPGAKS
ncbi:MAG: selenocysteine-specific translation elongation factor [Chloroflexi bacterium]|nr:selenocysteine-specific translation elongation factor [Chloroflexota bacterium]